MHTVLVIPMVLWLTVSVPILCTAFGVVVFLARHPVDGEARIAAWSDRNQVFCAIGGGVFFYLLFPSTIMLSIVLGLFLGVARFGEQLYEAAHENSGADWY